MAKGLTVVCFVVLAFVALPAVSALACAGEQRAAGEVSSATLQRAPSSAS